MSVSKSSEAITVIMDRISVATPTSQIAVFRSRDKDLKPVLDSRFAATVATRRRIRDFDPKLIGVYDRTMSRKAVKHEILFVASL